jgi:hypothetical protein
MSKSTDIFLRSASATAQRIAYRTPIKFGGRVVVDVVLLDVQVEVESRDGRRARGTGSMPMGNAWAWPSAALSSEATLAAMIELAQRLVRGAADYHEAGDYARFGGGSRRGGQRSRC